MTLLFSYKELFGSTPVDEPINLTNVEIAKLQKMCERRKAAQVDTTKEPTITTITFKPPSKKDAKKNEKIQLSDA